MEIGKNKSKLNVTRIILIFYNDQCLVFIGRITTLMNYGNVQVIICKAIIKYYFSILIVHQCKSLD